MAKTYTITFLCFLTISLLFKSSMAMGTAEQGTASIDMEEVISPALVQKEMKNRIKSLAYTKQDTTNTQSSYNTTSGDVSFNTTLPDLTLDTTLPDFSLNTTLPTLDLNTTVPVENVSTQTTTTTTTTNTGSTGTSTTIPSNIINTVVNALNNTVVPAVTNLFSSANKTNSESYLGNFVQLTLGLLSVALL
jgi:hypothetical protein